MFQRLLIVFLFALLLFGCAQAKDENGTDNNSNNPTDKAVQTIKWVVNPDDNYCQFYTNDKIYSGLIGSTNYNLTTSEIPKMNTITVDADKKSGNDKYCYGIIFCANENVGQTDVDKKYDFYEVSIYTDKNYRIAKRVMGVWYIINSKTYNSLLYEVTEGVNRIKVTFDQVNTFVLSFNGHEASGETISFTDNTGTTLITGGYYGYIVEVGKDESFPNTPVDVRFKQITP
jgi:hypothetical protein